ncbi:MAG TPA: methyltransferase domain-containing protein [Dehalococcoidia bacterium]|nr:methyltransferase domain-containing protein [Dehalococcoidia bacterium]
MEKEEYLRMYQLEKTHWWYEGMRRVSAAFLGRPGCRSWRILDAGCGTGAGLDFLASYGRAYGVDLAQEAMGFCRLRGVKRIARASVAGLPFPAGAFDLVTSFDVLYHRAVEDDLLALREFQRVLKEGGLLLLRVPAFDFLRGRHDVMVHTRHRYQAGEMVAKLEEAGFDVQRVSYANTLLFPLALAKRALERDGTADSDVKKTRGPLNALLTQVLAAEACWLRKGSLPFGLSLFALGRKPYGQGQGSRVKGQGERNRWP